LFKSWLQKINPVKALYIILFFELINISYYGYYLSNHGYLPSPFVLDKNDTLMDFYNPLYWVVKDGFYTIFNSVYPALNYFFLKIFSLGIAPDQISNPFQLRKDFPILGIIISFIYILIVWVVVNIGEWRKVDLGNKGLVFLTCILSVPVLFGLERGNLIFLGLLFLALYLNASNPWVKAVCFGLLVNIKPYFAILLIPYLNIYQFNKLELIRSSLIAAAIFFVSSLLVGVNIIDFFNGYLSFSNNTTLTVGGVVALPHSIAALSTIKALINFGEGSSYAFWFSLLKVINYVSVLFLFYLALVKKLSPLELLIASVLIITNFAISTGGYILIIYIALIPYLLQSKEYKLMLFCMVLIYALPLDWIPILKVEFLYIYSYLGGNLHINNPSFYLSIGSIFRPVLNFSLMIIFLIHLIRKYPKVVNVSIAK